MYVCICHGITDRDVRKAASEGCHELHELTMRTGLGSGCGSCVGLAGELLEQARTQVFPLPVLRAA